LKYAYNISQSVYAFAIYRYITIV